MFRRGRFGRKPKGVANRLARGTRSLPHRLDLQPPLPALNGSHIEEVPYALGQEELLVVEVGALL